MVAPQVSPALFFDLLDYQVYTELLAAPQRLGERTPRCHKDWVVVDEVHRLIESRRLRFVLTGSSARKLRRRGVNLLAGRALTRHPAPDANVVEPGLHRAETRLDVAEALAVYQLGEGQTHELVEAREAADLVLALVAGHAGVKLRQRETLHDLSAFAECAASG